MTFIYRSATFAPIWTTILKIRTIFVHQTLTEHALYSGHFQNTTRIKTFFGYATDIIKTVVQGWLIWPVGWGDDLILS